MPILQRLFHLSERRTTVSRELRGGVATFLTMAYILFVNPLILADAGVPRDSAVACTALAAAICCMLMGFYANFPLAAASGMGLNAFVAYTVALKVTHSWQVAMGLVVIDGFIVLLLVLAGLREVVMDAIPRDLRRAIGAGIGLFIAYIGLVNAGIVQQGVPVSTHGNLASHAVLVAAIGFVVAAVLTVRRVPGALLIGIVAATAAAFPLHVTTWPAHVGWPTLAGTAFKADVPGALHWAYVPALMALVLVDFFDTLGTATGIAEQAGLVDGQGRIVNLRRILIVDGLAASIGGLLGVSSVTAYVESAAGVAEGARTGLHSVFVGLLFFGAIFLAPLAGVVPKEATAPALVLVGFFMISQFTQIDFADASVAIPAFLVLIAIPLTYSISHGIGIGFLAFVAIKLVTLKWRDVHPMMYVVAIAFGAYFACGQG